MAHQNTTPYYSLPAAADLRTKQFCLAVINGSGLVALCGAGAMPDGILDNAPNLSAMARLFTASGHAMHLIAGAAGVTAGSLYCSDANGLLVAGTTGHYRVVKALETVASGEHFTGIFAPGRFGVVP